MGRSQIPWAAEASLFSPGCANRQIRQNQSNRSTVTPAGGENLVGVARFAGKVAATDTSFLFRLLGPINIA